jgi:hypothetical protein
LRSTIGVPAVAELSCQTPQRTVKRILFILALAVLPALLVHDVYEFVTSDDGLRYYTSEPRRLLYVLGLALGGGFAAFLFSRLKPQLQRGLKMSALGLVGASFTMCVWLFPYVLLRFRELLTWHDGGLIAVGSMGCGALAGYFWFEFIQVWKTGKTRFM